MKTIGPTFSDELKAAGLLGLQFSWGDDGVITFGPSMTQAEINAVNAVYAVHDPLATNKALIEREVQKVLDAKAQEKGYNDAATCISYMNSGNAVWKADATALNAWRDAVWAYVFQQESLVPVPSLSAILAGLPVAPW